MSEYTFWLNLGQLILTALVIPLLALMWNIHGHLVRLTTTLESALERIARIEKSQDWDGGERRRKR